MFDFSNCTDVCQFLDSCDDTRDLYISSDQPSNQACQEVCHPLWCLSSSKRLIEDITMLNRTMVASQCQQDEGTQKNGICTMCIIYKVNVNQNQNIECLEWKHTPSTMFESQYQINDELVQTMLLLQRQTVDCVNVDFELLY